MDKHQKALIAEEHGILAGALLEWHNAIQLLERSALLKMKPKKEQIAQLKKIIDDMKAQLKKAGPWTKSVFQDEIRKMEHQLELVMAESLDEGVPRYAKNMKGVSGVGKKGKKLKPRDIKDGMTVRINAPKDKDHGAEVYVSAVKPVDKAVIVKFGGKHGTRRGMYKWDELEAINEEAVSVGNGSIPTGPESVGVKVKPDFKFRGYAGFDCDPNTFGKCIKGKKKHKRWNTFLDRNDELVGKVKNYMGQSYKNTNFVLRNSGTGEMVMGRRT